MTLQEAIDISTNYRKDHHSFSTDIIGKAHQLGIEALKRIQDVRRSPSGAKWYLLPGETED